MEAEQFETSVGPVRMSIEGPYYWLSKLQGPSLSSAGRSLRISAVALRLCAACARRRRLEAG